MSLSATAATHLSEGSLGLSCEVIMYWRGQCSPGNNVQGDNMHR